MSAAVRDVVDALFARAPFELADAQDNVGLLVGDPQARVRRVLVCVDATMEVIAEARAVRAGLIVAHHPLMHTPLRRLRVDSADGAVIYAAARAGLSICAMHTNLDFAPAGLCVELARIVGLQDLRPLAPVAAPTLAKVAVFVPVSHVGAVRSAMAQAGAGHVGNYDECGFAIEGEGTYRPLPGAAPYLGKVGRLERAPESRLEMIVPRTAVGRVVRAMLDAHPYEEAAYDVYPLDNHWPNAARGAVGRLSRTTTLSALSSRLGKLLTSPAVRTIGRSSARIEKVAVVSGSGGDLVQAAADAGAEALLLGEMRHHQALWAHALGLGVIEAGHFATERHAVELMCRWLEQDFGARLAVTASVTERDPFADTAEAERRDRRQGAR